MATVVEFAMKLDGVDQVVRGLGRTDQAAVAVGRSVGGPASRGLDDFGKGLDLASRKAENFGGAALEGLIPVSARVSDALFDIVGNSQRGANALQLLAKSAIIVGGALAVGQIVEAGVHYLKFGETVDALTERLKKAAEEEKAFLDNLKKVGDLRRSIEVQLVAARSGIEASIDRGTGNELAAARHELEGKLALIELETDARRRQILTTVAMGQQRDQFLAKSEELSLLARRSAHETWQAALLKNITDERAAQLKAWQDETQGFIDQLKARLSARQAFEQQLGQGAEGLGVTDSATSGLRKLTKAREDFQKAMRDVAFLEREGQLRPQDASAERQKLVEGFTKTAEAIKTAFGGVPAVIDAVNAAIGKISVAPISTAMEEASKWVTAHIATVDELRGRYDQLSEQFTSKLPAAVNTAAPAVRKLTEDVTALSWAFHSATLQAAALNAVVGTQ